MQHSSKGQKTTILSNFRPNKKGAPRLVFRWAKEWRPPSPLCSFIIDRATFVGLMSDLRPNLGSWEWDEPNGWGLKGWLLAVWMESPHHYSIFSPITNKDFLFFDMLQNVTNQHMKYTKSSLNFIIKAKFMHHCIWWKMHKSVHL